MLFSQLLGHEFRSCLWNRDSNPEIVIVCSRQILQWDRRVVYFLLDAYYVDDTMGIVPDIVSIRLKIWTWKLLMAWPAYAEAPHAESTSVREY